MTNIETLPNGKSQIIATELPYMVNKANLIIKIAELVKLKKIDGITDIRDESNREGVRVVIELRKDANANVILNQLYKHTQLQDTFGVIMLALINACFIAGYTLVDGTGVRLAGSALGYTLWTFFMNGCCLLCWAMVARRREASRYLRQHWKKGILGGVGTMGSYGLALWAMTQAPLAVVAALRETSILFGALIAFIVLKEQLVALRIVAACGIAAGAILLRLS